MQPTAPAYNPNKEPARPYVRFETRPKELRNNDGSVRLEDEAWAIISAPGSRDSVEKVADEWLRGLETYAKDGRVPPSWPREYREAYKLWSEGETVPTHGTPIKTWPALSPSQCRMVLDSGILTVEDLAEANDSSLRRIGMGANSLKNMAKTWLEESQNKGSTAQALTAAMIKLEALQRTVEEQAETLRVLQAEPVKVKSSR